jgi:hypothetical protein
MEAKDRVFSEESERGRLPRKVKERAIGMIRDEHSNATKFGVPEWNKICHTNDNSIFWSRIVDEKFSEFWDAAVKDAELKRENEAKAVIGRAATAHDSQGNQVQEGSHATSTSEPSTAADTEEDGPSDTTDMQTCTVTLKQLVRPDIADRFDTIREILELTQRSVTDVITELSVLTHRATLAVSCELLITFIGVGIANGRNVYSYYECVYRWRLDYCMKILGHSPT